MADRFIYRGDKLRTGDDIRRRAREPGGNYDTFLTGKLPYFKPKEGENIIRILPKSWEEKDQGDWAEVITVHYEVGAQSQSYLCLKAMKEEDCPICELAAKLKPEEADAIRPSKRALCFVVDRDAEKLGPQVWSMPWSVRQELNERSQDRRTGEPLYIDHPEDGYDVYITRTGSQKKTKYTGLELTREPSPLHDNPDKADDWLDIIHDNPLPEMLNFYEPDYLEKVVRGQVERKPEDADRRERGRDDERSERGGRDERSRRSAFGDEEKPKEEARSRREKEPEEPETRRGRERDREEEPRSRRGRDEPETRREKEPEEEPRSRRSREEEPETRRGKEAEEEPRSRRGKEPEPEDDKNGKDEPGSNAREQLNKVRERRSRSDDDEKPSGGRYRETESRSSRR